MTEEGVERFTSGIRKRFHTIAHSKIINNTLLKNVICYYNFSIRKVDIRDSTTDLTFIQKVKVAFSRSIACMQYQIRLTATF